jgi:rod shape-determining protein MreD
MKFLVLFVALLAATILQSLLPGFGRFGHNKAPLMLGIVVYYALSRDRGLMITAALVGGFILDALGEIPLGYSACSLWVIGEVLHRQRNNILYQQVFTHVVIGAVSGGVMTTLMYLLLISNTNLSMSISSFLVLGIGSVLFGGVAIPLSYYLMGKLDGLVGNDVQRETY